jgi:uncharacterized membrane protein
MRFFFWAKLYFSCLLIMLALDALWIGVIAKNIYRSQLEGIMSADIRWLQGVLVYLILAGSVTYFAVAPALIKNEWQNAILNGAILGFSTYAVFDFTNMSLMRNWPLLISLLDIAWGTSLCGAVALAGYFISSMFKSS